jgi:predicted O-methyltransferase YrrM
MGLPGRVRYAVGRRRAALRLTRQLRQAARESNSPEDIIVAAVAGPADISIRPLQKWSEIEVLLELARAERPRRVLEIGTANGGTLYLLAWASSPEAHVLSVDICDYDRLQRRLFMSSAQGRRRVEVMRADSHLGSTRDAVAQFFDGPIDLLFIDGDHSAAGVRRDYELYAPLLRPGGLIAFHDIVDGAVGRVGGVPAFWREVRTELDDPRELVESWEQGGFGIGLGRARAV